MSLASLRSRSWHSLEIAERERESAEKGQNLLRLLLFLGDNEEGGREEGRSSFAFLPFETDGSLVGPRLLLPFSDVV